MTESRRPKCAQCRAPIELRPQNAHFPFCSARCKQVDLGRWLNEEYSLPVTASSTERSLPPLTWSDQPQDLDD